MKNLIGFSILAAASAACAADGPHDASMMKSNEATDMAHAPHVISVQSNADFSATLSQLRAAIETRGFKIFAVIDHAAGAASIEESLRPTTLVIFGNPRGGTPLMQAEQQLGLELPLKMLVAEDEAGAINLVYADMSHLFHEYGIAEMTGPLEKIEGALSAIAKEAGAN